MLAAINRSIADNANGKNPMEPRCAAPGRSSGLPACCAVAIAGASCMSPIPAPTATPGATTARAATSITVATAASRSVACASTATPAQVIERLQPLGIEAALAAQEARNRETADKRRQVELALEQAATKPLARDASMMPFSIPTIVLSPLSSRRDGMSDRLSSTIWRRSWRD